MNIALGFLVCFPVYFFLVSNIIVYESFSIVVDLTDGFICSMKVQRVKSMSAGNNVTIPFQMFLLFFFDYYDFLAGKTLSAQTCRLRVTLQCLSDASRIFTSNFARLFGYEITSYDMVCANVAKTRMVIKIHVSFTICWL